MKKIFFGVIFFILAFSSSILAINETDSEILYSIYDEKEGTAIIEGYAGYSTSLIIPSEIDGYKVTYINSLAFFNNNSLTKITLPDTIINIGSEAFNNCTSLKSINIPNKIPRINYATFRKCSKLSEIVIPNSVTYIDDYAFEGCTNLEKVNIPDTVEFIGYDVFMACENLVLDCSPNSYAAEYAKLNNINTGSLDKSLIFIVIILAVIGISTGIIYFTFIKKRK